MKFLRPLAALAFAAFTVHAQAVITYVVGPYAQPSAVGNYQPPTVYSMPDPNHWLDQVWGQDNYMGIYPGNPLTMDLHGALTFSYAWGWMNYTNYLNIDGQVFTGTEMYNGYQYVTFTSDTPMYQVTFYETGPICCYEVAFAKDWLGVTAVPEPQTWALLGAGLGLVAWQRRRQNWRNVTPAPALVWRKL